MSFTSWHVLLWHLLTHNAGKRRDDRTFALSKQLDSKTIHVSAKAVWISQHLSPDLQQLGYGRGWEQSHNTRFKSQYPTISTKCSKLPKLYSLPHIHSMSQQKILQEKSSHLNPQIMQLLSWSVQLKALNDINWILIWGSSYCWNPSMRLWGNTKSKFTTPVALSRTEKTLSPWSTILALKKLYMCIIKSLSIIIIIVCCQVNSDLWQPFSGFSR